LKFKFEFSLFPENWQTFYSLGLPFLLFPCSLALSSSLFLILFLLWAKPAQPPPLLLTRTRAQPIGPVADAAHLPLSPLRFFYRKASPRPGCLPLLPPHAGRPPPWSAPCGHQSHATLSLPPSGPSLSLSTSLAPTLAAPMLAPIQSLPCRYTAPHHCRATVPTPTGGNNLRLL
jgi:hypothetical protein